jgi:CheY-like chemotaxis protein
MMARPRILLVDDDASVLDLTQELLGLAGYAVLPAAGAAVALAHLAAGEQFDALITDHSMPGMSGEELIIRVRALVPALPCLLMTGHGDMAEELSVDVVVLRKPFRASELAAAVREVLAPGVE